MCVVASNIANIAKNAVSIVSSVARVASTISTNNQINAQYEYDKKINERNARIAEMNAANERQIGIEEARKARIETNRKISNQLAMMAANGFDVTSGTALDTIDDTAQLGELDALKIKYDAEKSALSYENQENNYYLKNYLLKANKKNDKFSTSLDLINSGLSTFQNTYENI